MQKMHGKKTKLGQNVTLLDIKTIDWIIDAKNAISHRIKQLKTFRFYINFARATLINFFYC